MRVFPHVIGVNDQTLAERLFKSDVKIVALTRRNRTGSPENAGEDALRVTRACHNQIFIKGSFKDSGVGDAEDRIRGFDVVSDARPGLRLTTLGYAAINVAANTKVEGPIALC